MSSREEFLAARLDEVEAKAKAAMSPPWLHMDLGSEGCVIVRKQTSREGRPGRVYFRANDLSVDHATAEHVATHDPGRVLRDVDAKRKILARHLAWQQSLRGGPQSPAPPAAIAAVASVLSDVIADLAAVYSDHPDYEEVSS